MNCKIVQRRLLSLLHPERVPANLRNHLMFCSACREWHNQLLLLEGHVRQLPVPASGGKARLVRRFLAEQAAPAHAAPLPMPAESNSATHSLAHALTVVWSRRGVIGVAGALVLMALGWMALQGWLDSQANSEGLNTRHEDTQGWHRLVR